MDASSPMNPSMGPQIDLTTVLSLVFVVIIFAAAHLASRALLPSTVISKVRLLFIWHAFDALIHTSLEASYLWNCFFVYRELPLADSDPARSHPASWQSSSSVAADPAAASRRYTAPGTYFLGRADRLYGAYYGTGATSRLWQEYARADARWGGADPVVISLELLTVFLGAPAAAGVCWGLVREARAVAAAGRSAGATAKAGYDPAGTSRKKGTWFFMAMLATGELYGGFMTFCPDWLVSSPNLDTSNWMYLWLYLVFFNVLWVFIPLWILYESYHVLTASSSDATHSITTTPGKVKKK